MSETSRDRLIFYGALSLLICHELDAVARHEWRLLPFLNQLDDQAGLNVFVLLHVPLFILIFWAATHREEAFRWMSQMVMNVLVIVHGIAHLLVSGHHLYEFEAPVETITVYGAAAVSALHAILLMRAGKPKA